jgi:hypothetical protein
MDGEVAPLELQVPRDKRRQGSRTIALEQYGLATDGSTDFADNDADGHNNYQEWRCLTNPTNSASAVQLLSALPAGDDVAVT